jgi:hypothetical protein
VARIAAYPELVRKLRLPGSSTFCYVGALHRTRSFDEDLLLSAPSGSRVLQFRLDDEQLLPCIASAERGSVVIVRPDDVKLLADRIEERLSNLHPTIEEARHRGATFLFLSTRPLTRYPGLAGSSVFVEAEKAVVKRLGVVESRSYLTHLGVAEAGISNLVRFSDGHRGLLDIFAEVEMSGLGSNEQRKKAIRAEVALAHEVYSELGPDIVTLLESWVFEAQLGEIEDDDLPSDTIHTALSESGLICRSEEGGYRLLPFANRAHWTTGLAEWLSAVIEPPESWTKVAAELFALERDLRRALALRYAVDHGEGWRSTVLEDVTAEILELARRDAIPAAHSLEDLRSPLDWLQLSRLLTMAEDVASAGAFLGLRAIEWQRFAREVLPVRHRVAHMRLVRPGDLDIVRRSRRLVAVRRRSRQASSPQT